MDTPTLFTQANRDIRIKVLFEVKDRIKNKATKFVPVDALRKELVLNYNFHLYTVHDIIDIVSHKLGGIHSSEPTTKEESILKIINELKPDMFMDQKIRPPVIAAIRKIILTVLNDLKSLEDAVKARTITGRLKQHFLEEYRLPAQLHLRKVCCCLSGFLNL